MNIQENEIKKKSFIPKELFHLVPKELFLNYLNMNGSYDCRNKKEWGMNSNFIHTTTTLKDLKEKVADEKWKSYPKEKEFILLKIYSDRIKSKLTYVIYNETIYYHIWGLLPSYSFEALSVNREKDGSFDLINIT